MAKSLKDQTLTGVIWSGLDSFGILFLKFSFSIAIARLLLPEDYGLIGMLAIFTGFASAIIGSGFRDALIQKNDVDNNDFSSVFIFNVSLGLFFYVVLFFAAVPIANFFYEPRLVIIARIISISLIIQSFGSIHITYFLKKMDLKSLARINAASALFSGITGLLLAYNNFGYWALVGQILSGGIINSSLCWIMNKWRPSIAFNINRLRILYQFGWKIFLQRFINMIYVNVYYMIIGKKFDTNTLGFYARAKRFQDFAVIQTSMTFSKVLFPAYSSIQDDRIKLAEANRNVFRLMVFGIYPLITLLIVTAKPFIAIFLTEKWLPVVPYLKLLYIEGFLYPFYVLNLNTVNSIGYSNESLRVELIKKVLLTISIIIGIQFGVKGLIVGQLISSFISYLISFQMLSKYLNYRFTNLLNDIKFPFIFSLIIFFSGVSVMRYLQLNNLMQLVIPIVSGIFLYFFFMKIVRARNYIDFINLIESYIPSILRKVL